MTVADLIANLSGVESDSEVRTSEGHLVILATVCAGRVVLVTAAGIRAHLSPLPVQRSRQRVHGGTVARYRPGTTAVMRMRRANVR